MQHKMFIEYVTLQSPMYRQRVMTDNKEGHLTAVHITIIANEAYEKGNR